MTRAAILSDIHGNYAALEAVLADLENIRPDVLVCLGDAAATGPQPRRVLDRLKTLDCAFVMGNTDDWLLHPEPWEADNPFQQAILDIETWGRGQLTATGLDFIRTFQPTQEITFDTGETMLCYHGSPQSYNNVIDAATPPDELDDLLAGVTAHVLIGGHTHEAMYRVYEDKILLNPGSVGLPKIARGGALVTPLRAEYALVESSPAGFRVSFRHVPVRLAALQKSVAESTMPHAERWLHGWQ